MRRTRNVRRVCSAEIDDDATHLSRFGSVTDDQVGINQFLYVCSLVVLGGAVCERVCRHTRAVACPRADLWWKAIQLELALHSEIRAVT